MGGRKSILSNCSVAVKLMLVSKSTCRSREVGSIKLIDDLLGGSE